MLDSVVMVGKKYYPRKNKTFNYINDDLEMTSSDEDDYFYSESDNYSND